MMSLLLCSIGLFEQIVLSCHLDRYNVGDSLISVVKDFHSCDTVIENYSFSSFKIIVISNN